jgi:hypothetical protein
MRQCHQQFGGDSAATQNRRRRYEHGQRHVIATVFNRSAREQRCRSQACVERSRLLAIVDLDVGARVSRRAPAIPTAVRPTPDRSPLSYVRTTRCVADVICCSAGRIPAADRA